MIIKEIRGNVLLDAKEKHIAFAVNTEGINDAGFAGTVSQLWPEIAHCGPRRIRTVISQEVDLEDGPITFHGLVCHSLNDGWGDSYTYLLDCLNSIPTNEPIAIIQIGAGMIGSMQGANCFKLKKAMQDSTKQLVLYIYP